MYIGNVEDYLTLRTTGVPVKTAMIPGFDKFQRISETQSWSLAMFKNVPEKELYKVQELAFFMVEFQQQLRLAEQTPYLAAHLKVFDNPFYRRERLARPQQPAGISQLGWQVQNCGHLGPRPGALPVYR
jgi:hypothetical protein